jgi:hypothetical protein
MKKKTLRPFSFKWISSEDVLSKISHPIEVECDSKIAAAYGDMHIGNKRFDENAYQKFCKRALGLDAFHVIEGDMIDGICRHSVIHNEVLEADPLLQAEMARDIIPDDGTLKYVIGGNHESDARKYLGNDINLCEVICEGRGDMIYCGDFYSRLLIDDMTMDLCHMKGMRFGGYSKKIESFFRQIIKDGMNDGVLYGYPDALAMGHYHDKHQCKPLGIRSIVGAGFKHFGDGREVGGWILDFNESDVKAHSLTY